MDVGFGQKPNIKAVRSPRPPEHTKVENLAVR
jgi:hypothetical protein